LAKGQVKRVGYKLASFYRWGPCDPDLYGSFKDYFKPGTVELEVRAALLQDLAGEPGRTDESRP
jgi:hypothetical protein